MIVQLFWSKQNDILLIEEPETSLHPEAQIHLPELFAEVIREKKALILTTHSEFLILALSKPVKKGLINSNDIAIYSLNKTPEGSQISALEVGDNGYIKGWIPSFTKVESELMKEFLETVPTE
jgi:predicted ATPase